MSTNRVRASGAVLTAALVLTTGIVDQAAVGASAPGTAAVGPPVREVGPRSTTAGVLKRTYAYDARHGDANTLDVYTPETAVGLSGLRLPTVVLVHGGAWTRGSRGSMTPQANKLARNGFVAVSVNYRLATEARWPAQRYDVSRAVAFLRSHATFFNVDRNALALMGSSAGGQIAAAVATQGNGRKRFAGLVVFSGLLNPRTVTQQDPDFEDEVVQDKLIGCDPEECPDRYISAIPAMDLNRGDVPSLLFHSRAEGPFNAEQSAEYVDFSRSVGVPSKLMLLAGDRHGTAYWQRISATVIDWLRARLG